MKTFLILALIGCVTAQTPTPNEFLQGKRLPGDFLVYERRFLHIDPGFNITDHFRYPEHKGDLYFYKLNRLELRDELNTVIFQGLYGGTDLLSVGYDFISPWGKTMNVSVKLWGQFIGACTKT